jgi:hypothetical protein
MDGMKDPADTELLGLELARLFFELESRGSRQKLIDLARSLVEAERRQPERAALSGPGTSGHH